MNVYSLLLSKILYIASKKLPYITTGARNIKFVITLCRRPSSSSKSCTTRKSKEPENGVEGRRNRRMMASIQSALLNGAPKPKNNNRKVLRKPSKDDLAFEDIANALERIKMADTDMSVSLADVRMCFHFHQSCSLFRAQ